MTAKMLAACAYAKLGYAIIPTGQDKRPLVQWRQYEQVPPEQEQLVEWWSNWPDANPAIICGKVSGLSVVDVDGPAGVESLKMLALPHTWTVRTPNDGYHLYYAYTPDLHQGAAFLPGLDVRSDGGYVLAPPSELAGREYRVVRNIVPFTRLDVPDALRERRRGVAPSSDPKTAKDPSWVVDALQGVPEAQRNDTATRLAGYFHHRGLRRDEIVTVLRPFALGCTPPMDLRELETTVDSVERYPTGSDLTHRGDLNVWQYL